MELDLHFMIIYLCLKFQSNTPIFSKDIARKPFVLSMGWTDVHTDNGDTVCSPIENGGVGEFYPKSKLTFILL